MTMQLNLHYFGKLRRKRDFVKSVGLSTEFYNLWNPWFNTCTRKNSFLPFLESKSKDDRTAWLFMTCNDTHTRIGLTIMSNDMAQREYPFSIFVEFTDSEFYEKNIILETLLFFTQRVEKFKKIVSIGDINLANFDVFKSSVDNNSINYNLESVVENYSLKFDSKYINDSIHSFWINLSNGSHIEHQGIFSCTLYNKIYG